MRGNKEGVHAEVEPLSFARRVEGSIEDNLVKTGRHSLQMKTFEAQCKLRTARHETEVNKIKLEIWDEFVWTPGYATYAKTKKRIAYWTAALIDEARADYSWREGLRALRRDEEVILEKTLADLPKRMGAVLARATVRASKTGQDLFCLTGGAK